MYGYPGIPWVGYLGVGYLGGTDGTLGPMGPGPQGPPIIKLNIDYVATMLGLNRIRKTEIPLLGPLEAGPGRCRSGPAGPVIRRVENFSIFFDFFSPVPGRSSGFF